jgi:deazaflavin-dependent oxidoreductase (nitroreductase family)
MVRASAAKMFDMREVHAPLARSTARCLEELQMDFNAPVIEEFRSHGGAVDQAMGGALKGLDLVLLHLVGRKSGKEYVTPVSYMEHDGAYLLLGSFAGAPEEPAWVRNIEAMSRLTLEFGDHREEAVATVHREGPEWERLYGLAREYPKWPFIVDYEKKTDRKFPVISAAPITTD